MQKKKSSVAETRSEPCTPDPHYTGDKPLKRCVIRTPCGWRSLLKSSRWQTVFKDQSLSLCNTLTFFFRLSPVSLDFAKQQTRWKPMKESSELSARFSKVHSWRHRFWLAWWCLWTGISKWKLEGVIFKYWEWLYCDTHTLATIHLTPTPVRLSAGCGDNLTRK